MSLFKVADKQSNSTAFIMLLNKCIMWGIMWGYVILMSTQEPTLLFKYRGATVVFVLVLIIN